MNTFFKRFFKIIKNKYLLVSLFFIIWLLFFDQNNLIDRVQDLHQTHQLKEDKAYYEEKIRADKQKLEELRTDRENLEKFAREQYYMKKDGEDIFIVDED